MKLKDLQEAEKAAVVLMLCAPSGLNRAWARPDHADANQLTVDGELEKLSSLSEDARKAVRQMMSEISGVELAHFTGVANVLRKKGMWPQEPHPDPLVANNIIDGK